MVFERIVDALTEAINEVKYILEKDDCTLPRDLHSQFEGDTLHN